MHGVSPAWAWYLPDLPQFDYSLLAWSSLTVSDPGTPPSPRQFTPLATVGDSLFLFGGYSGGTQRRRPHVIVAFISYLRNGRAPEDVFREQTGPTSQLSLATSTV